MVEKLIEEATTIQALWCGQLNCDPLLTKIEPGKLQFSLQKQNTPKWDFDSAISETVRAYEWTIIYT